MKHEHGQIVHIKINNIGLENREGEFSFHADFNVKKKKKLLSVGGNFQTASFRHSSPRWWMRFSLCIVISELRARTKGNSVSFQAFRASTLTRAYLMQVGICN